jgi:hypothetical protein
MRSQIRSRKRETFSAKGSEALVITAGLVVTLIAVITIFLYTPRITIAWKKALVATAGLVVTLIALIAVFLYTLGIDIHVR